MAQTRIAPPAAKPEGQWAFDPERTPLNGNEEMKQVDDGLSVRHRIETIYAHEGFASIPGDDLRGRMRWWGLYTQRRPGIDGGKTATLEPEELDDRYFMLRVRIDGGQLSLEQLRTIADISTEFARDSADITDRQNIQLHWIDVRDVPTIWERLESVGLSTQEACGDCPRVILGSRTSLVISISSVALATVFGMILGLFGGYLGGIWEVVTMRLVDALLTIPPILLAITVVAFLGPGIPNLIGVIR